MSSADEDMDDEEYGGDTLCTSITSCLKNSLSCTDGCKSSGKIGKSLVGYFPVWKHLRSYKWRKCLVNDVIAGLSVGVVHVPQGMGFALMAGVPPVYGLYTSLLPGWIYYIFGTSRHLSVGTMALIALMVGAVVGREDVAQYGAETIDMIDSSVMHADFEGSDNYLWLNETTESVTVTSDFLSTNATDHPTNDARIAYRVGVAVSLTLLVGVCQLIMRLLRLGVLTNYMSAPFVDGFMSGSAVHIMVSQLPFLLGLHIPRPAGSYFQVPRVLYTVVAHLPGVNICSLLTSIMAVTLIMVVKHINERFKSRMRAPVPAELLVVVIGTAVSHWGRLENLYALPVIGPVPLGLPAATVPPFYDWQNYFTDAILIAVVGFAIGLTMGKLMATKHKYEIDSNQELLAYGLVNTIGPFFGTFASTQAPPRTLVVSSSGGKTQLAGFISTILPLCVCLFLGPLFHSLPISILGSIVFAALVPLIGQIRDAPSLWRINRFDFITWLATFCFTVFVAVTVGLVAGMLISILLVVVQAQVVQGSTSVCLQTSPTSKNGIPSKSSLGFPTKLDTTVYYNGASNIDDNGAGVSISPASLRKRSQPLHSSKSASLKTKSDDIGAGDECERLSESRNKKNEHNGNIEVNDSQTMSCKEMKIANGEANEIKGSNMYHKDFDQDDSGIVLVFSFDANLFFANAERFKTELYRCTVDPAKLRKARKRKGCQGPSCWNRARLGRRSGQDDIGTPNHRAQIKKQAQKEAFWSLQRLHEGAANVETISVRELESGKDQYRIIEDKGILEYTSDLKTNEMSEISRITDTNTGDVASMKYPAASSDPEVLRNGKSLTSDSKFQNESNSEIARDSPPMEEQRRNESCYTQEDSDLGKEIQKHFARSTNNENIEKKITGVNESNESSLIPNSYTNDSASHFTGHNLDCNKQDNEEELNLGQEPCPTVQPQLDSGVTPRKLSHYTLSQVPEELTGDRLKQRERRVSLTSVSELLLLNQADSEESRNNTTAQCVSIKSNEHEGNRDTSTDIQSGNMTADTRVQLEQPHHHVIQITENAKGTKETQCSTNADKDNDDSPSLTGIKVDCRTITYVDVTGLNTLRHSRDELAEVGVKLELINFNRELSRKARLVGLKELLWRPRGNHS